MPIRNDYIPGNPGGGGMEIHGNEYHDPDMALAPDADHLVRSFTKGWTLGKLLKGAGVDADPTEISGWEKVAEVIAGSDLDYVDFDSLDINTDKVYLLVVNIKNPQASPSWLYLYRNGDNTPSNYYVELLLADNSTVSAGRYNTPGFTVAGASSSAFAYLFVVRDLDGYMLASGNFPRDRTSAVKWETSAVSSNNTTSNITSLRIAAAIAGAIGTGSVLMLYKLRTA